MKISNCSKIFNGITTCYLHASQEKLSRDFPYPTRQATGGHIRYSWDSGVEGCFIGRWTRDYKHIADEGNNKNYTHIKKS